jgi:hypothetical protein
MELLETETLMMISRLFYLFIYFITYVCQLVFMFLVLNIYETKFVMN